MVFTWVCHDECVRDIRFWKVHSSIRKHDEWHLLYLNMALNRRYGRAWFKCESSKLTYQGIAPFYGDAYNVCAPFYVGIYYFIVN